MRCGSDRLATASSKLSVSSAWKPSIERTKPVGSRNSRAKAVGRGESWGEAEMSRYRMMVLALRRVGDSTRAVRREASAWDEAGGNVAAPGESVSSQLEAGRADLPKAHTVHV